MARGVSSPYQDAKKNGGTIAISLFVLAALVTLYQKDAPQQLLYGPSGTDAALTDTAVESNGKKSGTVRGPGSTPTNVDLADVKGNARILASVTSNTWPKLRAKGSVDPSDPRLDFIKLNKVGGTSVATSLDRVAKRYGIKSSMGCKKTKDNHPPTFYFHHHTQASTKVCFGDGERNLVTVLRDPVAQYLSDKTWATNRGFFINFNEAKLCAPSNEGGYDCSAILKEKHEYALKRARGNVIRKALNSQNRVCYEYCSWLMGSTMTIGQEGRPVKEREGLADDLISTLQNDYLLVGVTDYLDHFIVLLGLRFHWDLNEMIYHKCKSLHGTSVKLRHLTESEQNAIKNKIGPSAHKAYEWAKERFEALIAELGQPFADVVDAFKAAVKARQAEIDATVKSPYKWRPTLYANGYREYC